MISRRPGVRATYDELLKEHAGVSMFDVPAVLEAANKRGIKTTGVDPDVVIGELFEQTVEDALVGPVFVIDYPAALLSVDQAQGEQSQNRRAI